MTSNAWLARDFKTKNASGSYLLFSEKPQIQRGGFWTSGKWGILIPHDSVEDLIEVRLNPGDGPIPVRISIERADDR